jgi:hypothetical protein
VKLAQTALLTHSGRGSALAGTMQLSRTTSHGSGSSGRNSLDRFRLRVQDPSGAGHKKSAPSECRGAH